MMPKNAEINRNIYAVYKGDNYIMQGTLREISEALGKSRRSLQVCASHKAAYKENYAAKKRKTKGRLRLFLLEENRSNQNEKPKMESGKHLRLHLTSEEYAKLKAYAETAGLTLQASCLEIISKECDR